MNDENTFVREKLSSDNKWLAVFEDNGETGCLYLCKMEKKLFKSKYKIVDTLWIYNKINPPIEECKNVYIMWSDDSTRVAFIVDRQCWGMFDLATRRKLNSHRDNGIIVNIPFEKWSSARAYSSKIEAHTALSILATVSPVANSRQSLTIGTATLR